MPKSRRGRHLSRSKRKGRKVFTAPAAKAPLVGEVNEPGPLAKAPKPKTPVMAAQTTDVAAELRRIGIVAGIIMVILVILALIFT